MQLLLLSFAGLAGIFSATYAQLAHLVALYGYLAISGLMILESASFPVPSEVLLPAVGIFSAQHILYLPLALVVVYISSFIGMAINYYIAYFIGKDVIYRHLSLFHIRKEQLAAFEEWFAKNGAFAVFISRLLPVVRGLINFPAGFALMDQKKFYAYSMLGAFIWDTILVMLGYSLGTYALSEGSSIAVMIAVIAAFGIVLYAIYKLAMRRIRKKQ